MLSTQGPAFAKADINNDGMDDFFVGGSVGSTGAIYMQKADNKFVPLPSQFFQPDTTAEEVSGVFFDADNDKDLDLYVVTGGTEHTTSSLHQADRLYVNQGIVERNTELRNNGRSASSNFSKRQLCRSPQTLIMMVIWIFLSARRVIPTHYGVPCDQTLLINDGKGFFKDATGSVAPDLKKLGMVTDAYWFDYDKNNFLDLLVVGEWMPVTLFLNDGKKLSKAERCSRVESYGGMVE